MDTLRIRAACRADLDEWCRMRTKLWPRTATEHPAELEAFFNGSSIDIVETFMLERTNGALAGFIEINIRNFAEGSRSPKVPYVEAWYVDPDLRGQGYGEKLMVAAETWALNNGFSEIASDTELKNEGGIAAHQALGFTEVERVVCFMKKLSR